MLENELKASMARRSVTSASLAEMIGMSVQTMSYKLNGKREFTNSEAIAIVNALNLSLSERELIFFEKQVEK